jgi:hypothetical protein
MLNRFRDRFGPAGLIVAISALVFALAGGAYAASGALTGKQKKEVEKIAKKFQGTGPAGAQGPAGSKGDTGAQGKEGPQGEQGVQGKQGIQGEPGPLVETLPGGKTLTGAWGFTGASNTVAISYQFKLSSPLAAEDIVFVAAGGGGTGDCPGNEEEPEAAAGKLCIYASNPEAEFKTIPGVFPHSRATGAVLFMGGGLGVGTWALTAE